jgi:hypothetical protein
VISPATTVMGVGGELNDNKKSEGPELILVKPNVAVMSKSVMNLLNPNGWYCLKGKVSVMAKTEINLGCTTHITSTSEANVLGKSDKETGVTVLGKTVVNKVGCTGSTGSSREGDAH